MVVDIYSKFFVQIIHRGKSICLEYDDAADYVEAVEAEPERWEELAEIAFNNAEEKQQ